MYEAYQPRFRHSAAAFIASVACMIGSEFAVEHFYLRAFLWMATAFWLWICVRIIGAILYGYKVEKKTNEQDSERQNLQAVTDFARVLAPKLPGQSLVQVLAAQFPNMGLDAIHVPDETATTRGPNNDYTVIQFAYGLATDEQWQKFADFYFSGYKTLAVNQWTENAGGTKVFTRQQYEVILGEWERAGATRKLPNKEYEFLQVGEKWLETKRTK